MRIKVNYLGMPWDNVRHAVEVMQELGIEYRMGTAQPIGDCWIFDDVVEDTLPSELPDYMDVMK